MQRLGAGMAGFALIWIAGVSAAGASATLPSSTEVARNVSLVFAGDPGAAAGDVNADGRANAADVCGTLLGMRNPTQPGPFGVGVRRLTFVKQSETMPERQRVLDTWIWYPSDPETAPIERFPRGRPDSPLAGGGNSPLILFSHGSCGIPSQSFFYVTTLASYGFIVAAPPHPGNTTGDFLTCSTPAEIADSFVNRPADISFVLDEMLALNDDPESFFAAAIDPEKIGMTGHSFGGLTTLRVSALDDRIIAGVPLAPAFFETIEDEVRSIDIPMMIQGGEIDSVTRFAVTALPAYGLLGAPKYLVEILRTGHYAFTDLCVPSPECGRPGTLTQPEAHGSILRYAVPFFLHYLAGDHRYDAFLEPPAVPPGIVLASEVDSG